MESLVHCSMFYHILLGFNTLALRPLLALFQNLTDANDMLHKQVDNLNKQLEEAISQMDRTTEDYAKLKVDKVLKIIVHFGWWH